jgi:hypothetical protein
MGIVTIPDFSHQPRLATMRTILCLFVCLISLPAWSAGASGVPSWGREVIHYKVNPRTGAEERTGSTESESDPSRNMLTQITKDARGVVIGRREFIMDSKGRIRRGAIWDGRGNLKGRTEYGFDTYDRINEERMFHASGRLIRRMLFKYDATSRRLVDKFYTWNEKDPYGPLVESKPGKDDVPFLPVQKSDKELPGLGIPQFRGMEAPTQAAAPTQVPRAPAPPQKKGFFDKLLKR